MKTLYISDLDGTLLTPEQTLSKYTIDVIGSLPEKTVFSYATARSLYTASKVTAGLNIEMPVILYNGAFIINNKSREILLSNYFSAENLSFAADILRYYGIWPIVYSYISGKEAFS